MSLSPESFPGEEWGRLGLVRAPFDLAAAGFEDVEALLFRGIVVGFDLEEVEVEGRRLELLRVIRAYLALGADPEALVVVSSSDDESGSGAARFFPLRSGTGSLITIPLEVEAVERRGLMEL